jgi:hypothetical protein
MFGPWRKLQRAGRGAWVQRRRPAVRLGQTLRHDNHGRRRPIGARRTRIAAAVAAMLCGIAAAARAACLNTPEATLHLPAIPGPPVIEALVDGRPARFVLDSGAARSLLSGAAVARLGLPGDAWTSTSLRGIGGIERHRDAAVASLTVAGIPLARPMGPVRSLPVIPELAGGADGLLGADLLAGQDLELTGGGLTLILRHATGCAGLSPQAARPLLFPWAEAVAPSLAVRPGLFIVAVRVGGATLRALIDTGSSISIIAPAAAARLGVDDAALAADRPATARGVGPGRVALRLHDFGKLTLADDPTLPLGAGPLWVGRLPPLAFDLLIGMDRLRALHLGLSHTTAAIYVARLSHTD